MTGDKIDADKKEGNVTIKATTGDTPSEYTATVKLTQKTEDWQDASLKGSTIGGMDAGKPTAGGTATITVKADGSGATLSYQ